MSTDIMDSFSPLDEMIQLIYQNIYQFVVMSSVTSDKWTVHVGMVGDGGRWWRGVWEEKDVVAAVGPKPSEKLLEVFVDKLAASIIGGELYLAGFNTEKDAKFKLTFGPTNAKTVSMDLDEIRPEEAAAHATNVFLEIALQAQSRKCRLHPSTFTSTSVPATVTPIGTSNRASGIEAGGVRDLDKGRERGEIASSTKSRPKSSELEPRDVEMKEAEHRITASRTEEKEKPKKRIHSPPGERQPRSTSNKPKSAAGSKAAASLANPTKKARKIQAMEFESDED